MESPSNFSLPQPWLALECLPAEPALQAGVGRLLPTVMSGVSEKEENSIEV